MQSFDLPPIWLIGFITASWAVGRLLPGLTIEAAWPRWLAVLLILTGILLMVLAVWQMSRAGTTVVPHRQPSALVTSGVFSLSRNPIYLADVLILTGAVLWFGAVTALLLIPIFIRVINRRFILPEEARLREGFAEEFGRWSETTRRWL